MAKNTNAQKVANNLNRLIKQGDTSEGLSVKVDEAGKPVLKGSLDKKWHGFTIAKSGKVSCNGKTFTIDMKVEKPFNSFRRGLIAAGLKGIKAASTNAVTLG